MRRNAGNKRRDSHAYLKKISPFASGANVLEIHTSVAGLAADEQQR
jgi:hypothetical protein